MDRRIILFELNEVPYKVVDQFVRWCPDSVLAERLPGCHQYDTRTTEVGHLSPWITWPTLHRGVNGEKHFIHDFGQDLREVDAAYPTVWELLRRNGVRVGVCGTLHTYPMPDDLQNVDFFIPDTFAAGSECFPKAVEQFQEFNLRMARESARNVARGVPWMQALRFLAAAPELGLKPQTMLDLGAQLLSERAQKWRLVRRRTYQSVLAFDVFMKQLEKTRPGFSTFFTNHVASSMHRFWAASFPDEYADMGFPDEWIRTYRKEIDWTMRMADRMFGRLVAFADRNPDYQVWVATSMGQAATKAEPLETQLYIVDLAKFMLGMGFDATQWSKRPAMLPQWNVLMDPGSEGAFHEALSQLDVDGRPVCFRRKEHGFFSIDFGHKNTHKGRQVIRLRGTEHRFEDFGLKAVEISDLSDSTAYHIPEGCLFIYDPMERSVKPHRPVIATTEIVPAILRNFSVATPAYMARPTGLAAG